MSSERDSPMNFQTKYSFYQPIGIEMLCERESPMCFQTKPLFSSQWESKLCLIRFGNTLGCPSRMTLIHSPFVDYYCRYIFYIFMIFMNSIQFFTKHYSILLLSVPQEFNVPKVAIPITLLSTATIS